MYFQVYAYIQQLIGQSKSIKAQPHCPDLQQFGRPIPTPELPMYSAETLIIANQPLLCPALLPSLPSVGIDLKTTP